MLRSDATITRELHPSAEELAAYLDRQLQARRVGEIEGHLAECDACRADVVASRRAINSQPKVPRGIIASVTGIAALLLIGLPAVSNRQRDRDSGAVRAASPLANQATTLFPADNAVLSRDSTRFIWSEAGSRAQYRLSVTDSTGNPVWSTNTADTLVVPPGEKLRDAGAYFWFVDALLPDGGSRSSGTHRFVITR